MAEERLRAAALRRFAAALRRGALLDLLLAFERGVMTVLRLRLRQSKDQSTPKRALIVIAKGDAEQPTIDCLKLRLQPPHEIGKTDLALALEAFGGENRTQLGKGSALITIDDHIIVFRP